MVKEVVYVFVGQEETPAKNINLERLEFLTERLIESRSKPHGYPPILFHKAEKAHQVRAM